MKRKNAKRNMQHATRSNPRFAYLVSRVSPLNQLGVAPLVFLAISGIFLAGVLILIATQSFGGRLTGTAPAPSGTTIGGVVIASPVPVDPKDPALCDDEYNADCDNLEGDDVDPADLAGPD
mgnify:CR=1 FL=1|jgi:hypothetical protein